MSIALYIEGVKPGRVRRLATLHRAEVQIHHCRTGSRDYLAADMQCRIRNPLVQRVIFDNVAPGLWVVWRESRWRRKEFVRVHTVQRDGSAFNFHCDQSKVAGLTMVRGTGLVRLRLVEPSPPRPGSEWWEAERSRAINDYIAEHGGEVDQIFEMYRR